MKLHRHTSTRVTIDGRRHYETPLGKLPSVTAVLRATKDVSGLMAWRRKVGAEHADAVTKAATDRGTALHGDVEVLLTEGRMPDEPTPFFSSLVPFLNRITSAALVEGTVWHPLGYAGAVDLVAEVDGELTIVDWKTSSRPKRHEWIEDYRLQVAAYTAAVNRVYDLRIKKGFVVVALEDREAQVFEESGSELFKSWQGFQERLGRYKAGQR